MKDIYALSPQIPNQFEQAYRILSSFPGVAAHPADAFAFQEIPKPRCNRFERSKKHSITFSIPPLSKMWKEATCIVRLREVKYR